MRDARRSVTRGDDGDGGTERARPPTRLRFEAKVPKATPGRPPPRAPGRRPLLIARFSGLDREDRAHRHRDRPQRHDKDNVRHLSRALTSPERSIEHARDEFATRKPLKVKYTNKVAPSPMPLPHRNRIATAGGAAFTKIEFENVETAEMITK